MSYASQQDLVERYGAVMLTDLTDRADPPSGSIDEAVVLRALADSDAMIDGYLKGRYALPLAVTPPALRDLGVAIAIYKLHRDTSSDKIRQDYVDACKTLLQIAAGTVRLDVAGVEPEASGASGVRISDRRRDLTPGNLRGFI